MEELSKKITRSTKQDTRLTTSIDMQRYTCYSPITPQICKVFYKLMSELKYMYFHMFGVVSQWYLISNLIYLTYKAHILCTRHIQSALVVTQMSAEVLIIFATVINWTKIYICYQVLQLHKESNAKMCLREG